MNHSEAENHMLSVPALDMYYGGHMDSNASQAAMAATERRLYALPIIRERIEDNREELTELENCGVEALRHHSASLVRLIRPGMASDAGRGPFRPDGRTQGAAGGGRARSPQNAARPALHRGGPLLSHHRAEVLRQREGRRRGAASPLRSRNGAPQPQAARPPGWRSRLYGVECI